MKFQLLFGVLFIVCQFYLSSANSEKNMKIIDGYKVDIKDASFVIALLLRGKFQCGGSLLSEKFVLSAAHCFHSSRDAKNYKIRVMSSVGYEGGTVYKVKQIYVHEEYQDDESSYDFALLKLDCTRHFPKNITFLKLPRENEESKTGEEMIVYGYGTTLTGRDDDYLRAVEVPIYDFKKCQNDYLKNTPYVVTDSMICAGYSEGGKDSCQGDSGGPLKRVADDVIIGVVSWGAECAQPQAPGVYAKVSVVRSWINEITGI